MYSLILLAVLSFALSFLLTPAVRHLCRRWGVVDHPGGRKSHDSPVPRAGGVALVLSYLLACAILLAIGFKADDLIWSVRAEIFRLIPAAALVFLVGLADDVRGLKAGSKLLGETAAGAAAYLAGVHVVNFGGHALSPWLSLPATVLWLLACTNALNLIDGLDGLACGIGLFAAVTTLFAAGVQHNIALALAVAPLLGALAGFLRYNYNPATIFLGDSGSLFTGFLLGCFGILWSQKSATLLGMTAPVIALAIPLLDTSLSIIRRFLRNRPIFTADRGHIHHRLLDRGITPHRVVLLLYACCALAALCSLAVMNSHTAEAALILFGALIWIGVNYLGYVEFGLAARLFHPRSFHRILTAQMHLLRLEEELAAATSVDQCWRAVRSAARELGFSTLSMRVDHTFYEERFSPGPPAPQQTWTIRVPLSGTEFVNVGHDFRNPTAPLVMGPLADVLRRTLEPKLKTFHTGVPDNAPIRIVRYENAS